MRWLALLLLWPALSLGQPACWPAGFNDAVFKFDQTCYALGWQCQGKRYVVAGPRSAFVPDWRELGLSLLTATDEERAAAWKQNVVGPIPNVCQSLASQVSSRLYADFVGTNTFVVAPAGVSANPPNTRPAFPLVDGKRVTKSNGRATSGSPCDCAIREGDYCSVNGKTDQVALCVVKQ